MGGGQLQQRLRCFSVGRVPPLLQARYGIDLLVERLVCNTGTPAPAEKNVN
jgi:hypothetical protein